MRVPCSNRGRKAAQINAGFLKGVSSTSFGDTASSRILTHQTSLIHVTSVCKDKR
ncbi:hypothetical protein DPMN_184924 [Dreissena polymorpha]|uniref:Uncharacterized protein n=1 Tax=Dreissena polymorpha TaxID=45954 RepID=A0A9D4I8A8_DREPO|nr:hypothetical protein DPMN_184924 [Dreissena polymorpha]